jgi:predicted outer membrane repeat protein
MFHSGRPTLLLMAALFVRCHRLLQSRLMAYKDASKLAGGYATSGTKSLAPDMAAHLTKVSNNVKCSGGSISTTGLCSVSCPGRVADDRLA